MAIAVGDTVEVLGHRNAYGQDISSWREFPFKSGQTFRVGKVEDCDSGYPCPLIFPVGEDSEFWREDDLRIVERTCIADRIRELREERGIGLIEAKRIAEREEILEEIDRARTVEHLKPILRQLLART